MPEPIFINLPMVCRRLKVPYQRVWNLAVAGKIPVEEAPNGKLRARADNLPKIARVLGVEVPAA